MDNSNVCAYKLVHEDENQYRSLSQHGLEVCKECDGRWYPIHTQSDHLIQQKLCCHLGTRHSVTSSATIQQNNQITPYGLMDANDFVTITQHMYNSKWNKQIKLTV